MKYIFISLILFLTIPACTVDNTVETIDELTVHAYLHADQYMDSIVFGKVIPLDSSEATAAPESLSPMVINESGGIFPLIYSGVEGKYINEDLLITAGETYRLEVDYQGKTITAEAYIPSQPSDLLLSDSIIYRTKIDDFTDLQSQGIPDPIELSWNGVEGEFYFVQVENIENDPEPINELFATGEGPPRPNFQTEPSSDPFYAIDAFRSITHYGTYEVTVYQVNPEYVALYEDNTSGSGSLNEIRTNVENGFGIFTGINSTKLYLEVKRQ